MWIYHGTNTLNKSNTCMKMDTPKLERLKCHEVSMFQNKSRVCPQIFLCCWYTLRSTQLCTTPRRNPPKQFANPCPAPSPPKNDSGPTIAILIKKGKIMPSIIPLHPWNLTVSIYLQENASQASWTLYKGPTTPNATSFPPKKPMPTIKRSPYPPSFPQQGLNIWRVWCRIKKNTPLQDFSPPLSNHKSRHSRTWASRTFLLSVPSPEVPSFCANFWRRAMMFCQDTCVGGF